jgi:general nucleoside transport system permease protein
MITLITSLLAITISAGTSLLYATIGEIYTERSGILNLGIEGMMLMGAVSSFAVSYYTESLFLAVLVAMAVTAFMALIHAFLTITMKANQVVSGLSITIFGTGLSSFLGKRLGPEVNNFNLYGVNAKSFPDIHIPVIGDWPIFSAILNQDILTYIVYLIIPIAWFFMYKTKKGLNLRAVGENPRTAEAMGINVVRTRYIYTVVGGVFAGIGGAHLALAYTPGWNEHITGGRGWIVIALVIFAMWNPGKAILGTLLFGGINAIQFRLQAAGTDIPASLLNMLPYLVTVLALVVLTVYENYGKKKIGAPSALGNPYMREDK